VKNIRCFVGKRMIVGMDTAIQMTSIDLDDLVTKEDNLAGVSGSSGRRTASVKLGRPFWDTRRYLDHTRILAKKGSDFYTTPAVLEGVLDEKKRKQHTPGSMVTADGKSMNRKFFGLLPEALHCTQAVNKAVFSGESHVEVNLFVARASDKEATQDALVEWIREHATSANDIMRTFPGSQKRFLASEEVDAEIEEAMLDPDFPANLRIDWNTKSSLKVAQKAELLGRVRHHLNSSRPSRPLPQTQIQNMSTDSQVAVDIAATLAHPLMSSNY
jgi:hypothetical protein